MKKVILFAAVLSAFSFASCKKDRSCTCSSTSTTTTVTDWDNSTTSDTDTDTDSDAGVIVYNDAKKKDAKKACIDSNSEDVYTYDTYGFNPEGDLDDATVTQTRKTSTTCDLK
jgi:hypothetical protein